MGSCHLYLLILSFYHACFSNTVNCWSTFMRMSLPHVIFPWAYTLSIGLSNCVSNCRCNCGSNKHYFGTFSTYLVTKIVTFFLMSSSFVYCYGKRYEYDISCLSFAPFIFSCEKLLFFCQRKCQSCHETCLKMLFFIPVKNSLWSFIWIMCT